MAAKRAVQQKALYAKLIGLWPKDPLRPEADFPKFLATRLEADWGNAPAVKVGTEGREKFERVDDGSKPPIMGPVAPQASVEEQWAALAGLVGDKYLKKYPVKKLQEPAFDPEYYTRLVKELDEAPKRSWLGGYLNSWKGFIRWEH